jgi:lipopolysaccharide heptosyltransferase I
MPDPRRILIIRPSALGDVCRTVPVLASLRRAWPEATIDWIVQDDFAPAVAAHPALHELIAFPRRRWARWWRRPRAARELLGWLASLRRRRYDLVLDCQGLSRSGIMTWCTRAPRRIGHRDARELAWLGYNTRVRHEPARHAVERMLDLVRAAGAEPIPDMRLYVPATDLQWWETRRAELIGSSPYAVLAPTSRWSSKRWPAASWIDLVQPLAERGCARCVLIGAPGEHAQIPDFPAPASPRIVDLAGETTIGQTMAIIKGAAVLIANDSAPLHMAAGLERPCIGLFGPTDPALVGPYAERAVALRRVEPAEGEATHYRDAGLGDELMRRIRPGEVIEHLEAILAPGPPAGATSTTTAPAASPGGDAPP